MTSAGAADAPGTTARDSTAHERLRDSGIESRPEIGEAALPQLLALAYDETRTGNITNGHEIRLCDEAAGAVRLILVGRDAIEPWRFDMAMEGAKHLEDVRAEAGKRGHGPPAASKD